MLARLRTSRTQAHTSGARTMTSPSAGSRGPQETNTRGLRTPGTQAPETGAWTVTSAQCSEALEKQQGWWSPVSCRYGLGCWKPGCSFGHERSHQRRDFLQNLASFSASLADGGRQQVPRTMAQPLKGRGAPVGDKRGRDVLRASSAEP